MKENFKKFSDHANIGSCEYICAYMFVCEHCRYSVPENEKWYM